jgi:hypothetical protein
VAHRLTAALEPPLQGPLGQSESRRGLVLRQPLQVAEQQRGAERLGQPGQFRVDEFAHLAPGAFVPARPSRAADRFVTGPARAGAQHFQGDTAGDAVQPAPDGVPLADGRGLAGEDQERGLEHVLRVLVVPEDRQRGVENGPAVSLDQGSERRLVPVSGEPLQQVVVGEVAVRLGGGDTREGGRVGHGPSGARLTL